MKALKYGTFYENIIVESIDLEEYGITGDSLYGKIKVVYNIFLREYVCPHTRAKFNNSEISMFADWLRGLPSCLNIPFQDADIIEKAEQGGFEFLIPEIKQAFLLQYWHNLAHAFFTLKDNL